MSSVLMIANFKALPEMAARWPKWNAPEPAADVAIREIIVGTSQICESWGGENVPY